MPNTQTYLNHSVKHDILYSSPSFVSPPCVLAIQIEQSSQRFQSILFKPCNILFNKISHLGLVVYQLLDLS